jgi:predicted MFS family arabinose efflux permease
MRACDTLLPALTQEFSVTVGQAARAIFVFAIAYGICQLCFGPLGDRYGKLKVIALCALACVIGNGLAGAAPTLDWLVAARIVSGGCAAGIFPLAMAWIGDNVPYEARQVSLARLISGGVTGMLAGQWISGLVAQWIGWRMVFVLMAAVFAVVGGLLLKSALRHAGETAAAARGLGAMLEVLRLPRARWIFALTTVEGAFAYGALAFMPNLLQTHHAASLSTAGGIAAFYAVGGFVYSRLAARLLRRIGETGLVCLGGATLCAGLLLFAYVPVMAWTPLGCALAGFGFYSLHNTLQTNATQMAPRARGVAMSIFACFLFLGQSVGIMAAAWVADHLTDTLIFAVDGVGLLILALIARWYLGRPAVTAG